MTDHSTDRVARARGRFARGVLLACSAAALVAAAEVGALQVVQQVSLAVSKETAPPGGMAQVKVHVTEPKPITTGRGSFTFDAYESVEGIALMNHLEDVTGVAVVRGTSIAMRFSSPSATFGMDSDYPVLTIAGRIPAAAPLGVKYQLTFDNSTLQLFDPDLNPYIIETKAGHIITAAGVSIHDVNPGSAVVPAGGVVTLTGSDFRRDTEIKFSEAKLSQVRYIGPGRIDVVVAAETRMHGMRIKASNSDGSRSTYFSYQRTYPMAPSDDPVLGHVVPLTQPHGLSAATVAFPSPGVAQVHGLAVQNFEGTEATVSAELLAADGGVIAVSSLRVKASHYIVRSLSELFGTTPAAECTVRISSGVPVQVLGVTADQGSGEAWPVGIR